MRRGSGQTSRLGSETSLRTALTRAADQPSARATGRAIPLASFGAVRRLMVLLVLLLTVGFLSLLIGRYPISPSAVLGILASALLPTTSAAPDTMTTVVLDVRIPRVVAGAVVGGALAAAGAAYQSLFKNPLASPGLLGVTSGAGFGAALALLLGLPWLAVQASAFTFGLMAVTIAYVVARSLGNGSLVVLILAGVVISAFFQALISITQYLADPLTTLPSITFWLMGGLGKVTTRDVLALVPISIGLFVLLALRWRVNVLSLGDEEAIALGVDLARTRLIVVLSATLMTAAAVSLSGIIGWVGLVVPHLARAVVGPNFPVLLPASFLLGGSFLVAIDTIARSATSAEIPLGILTALIGAPFFIALLARARQGWV